MELPVNKQVKQFKSDIARLESEVEMYEAILKRIADEQPNLVNKVFDEINKEPKKEKSNEW